jgi:pimeloyl-ACP methyl ester carboxylesterase
MSRIAVVSAALLAFACALAGAQTPAGELLWVQGGPYRLKTGLYRAAKLGPTPVLVVVLHGDAPNHQPDYQDTFAARVAAANADVIAAAILRPGYTDPQGHTSEGERGQTTGDNWNARNVDAIAAAIDSLRLRFKARRVVAVGHSGGAAIAANILGRHPDLLDAALLVSCPCDVTRWREHMLEKTGFAGFQGAIVTVSPIDLVNAIGEGTRIDMIVGAQDDVAPPTLSQEYRAAATHLGKRVHLTELPGKGHEILLDPAVLPAVTPLLR